MSSEKDKWVQKQNEAKKHDGYLSLMERAKAANKLIDRVDKVAEEHLKKLPKDSRFDFELAEWNYHQLAVEQKLDYDMERSWHKELHHIVTAHKQFSSFVKHYSEEAPLNYETDGVAMEDDFTRIASQVVKSSVAFLEIIADEKNVGLEEKLSIEKLKEIFKEIESTTNLDNPHQPIMSGRGK